MDQLLNELPQDLQAAFKKTQEDIERLHRVAIHEPESKMDIAEHKEWALHSLETLAAATANNLAAEYIGEVCHVDYNQYITTPSGERVNVDHIGVKSGDSVFWDESIRTVWAYFSVEEAANQPVHIPEGLDFLRSKRDELILDKFDGHNQLQLAQHFGISDRAVYHILKNAGYKVELPLPEVRLKINNVDDLSTEEMRFIIKQMMRQQSLNQNDQR